MSLRRLPVLPRYTVAPGLTAPADDGCELRVLHPRFHQCTTCPLPACIEDLGPAGRRTLHVTLRRVLAQLHAESDAAAEGES